MDVKPARASSEGCPRTSTRSLPSDTQPASGSDLPCSVSAQDLYLGGFAASHYDQGDDRESEPCDERRHSLVTVGMLPATPELFSQFEAAAGHRVAVTYDLPAVLKTRFLEGVPADVLIRGPQIRE